MSVRTTEQDIQLAALKHTLTAAGAEAVLRAAEAKASESGVPTTIAVVDAAGALMSFRRMDGLPAITVEWTLNKAYTAAALRTPTHLLAEGVQDSPALAGSMISLSRVNLVVGGYPLVWDGEVIGGVGAGGGTPEQDRAIAEAGAAAL